MLMSAPAGVLRNSSISLVSTGRGVEYATRFSVTAFDRAGAAVAVVSAATRTSSERAASTRRGIRDLLLSAISIRVMDISRPYDLYKSTAYGERTLAWAGVNWY